MIHLSLVIKLTIPQVAVQDSALIGTLGHDNPIHFQIYKSPLASESGFHLKYYSITFRNTLSRLLPMLENMSFMLLMNVRLSLWLLKMLISSSTMS